MGEEEEGQVKKGGYAWLKEVENKKRREKEKLKGYVVI